VAGALSLSLNSTLQPQSEQLQQFQFKPLRVKYVRVDVASYLRVTSEYSWIKPVLQSSPIHRMEQENPFCPQGPYNEKD
jgi:hypothetical protein